MKLRHYAIGQIVLFRNPHHGGLVSTLNVRGEVKEKVGRDLYKVQYEDRYIVLFGCQMVPHTELSDTDACPVSLVSGNSSSLITNADLVLDKVYVYADLQRNYILARRRYKQCACVDAISKLVDATTTDLTTLYYLAIDCGFLASLTDDDQWRSTLGMYHETLLGYLQSNRFQCYLSGLYFWENFRAQTIPLLVTCVSRQAIPLFHYFSDCVNQGTCSHICCKLWLETACRNAGLQSLQPVQPYSEGTLHNSLMILADVATKELQMRQDAKMPEYRKKLVGKHKIEVTQHHMKGKVHKQTKLTGEKHKIEVTQHHMKGKVHKQTKLTG